MDDLSALLATIPAELCPQRDALDKAAIVAMTDVQGTIIYANPKFCELSGYSHDELIGANHRILNSGTHDKSFFHDMYRTIANGGVWHGQICNRAKQGHLYWVDTTIVPQYSPDDKLIGYISIRFDITRLKEVETSLWQSANIDSLTGLLNRAALIRKLVEKVHGTRAGAEGFVFALLDIDDFKEINDFFGHTAGDELLRVIGNRLAAALPSNATIARLGGDEFAAILPGIHDADSLQKAMDKVLQAMRQPISIAGALRSTPTSIGIALCPQDGDDDAQIIKNADIALYRAKALGGDRTVIFELDMALAVERRAELRHLAITGLRRHEFELFYQPTLSLKTGRTSGLEALLRWHHPLGGTIAPGQFRSVFDDPGLAAAIGDFVLRAALDQAKEWASNNLAFGKIAINVTASDFRADAYVDTFLAALKNSNLAPQAFCIEVTETMFLGRSAERIKQGLHRLHEAGIKIALDDFGTGYASLTELVDLPIDRLKIDRSFVQGIGQRHKAEAIIIRMIQLAQDLGIKVTAEGVETREQVEFLRRHGCDDAQGYWFSRPVPARIASSFIPEEKADPIATLSPSRSNRAQPLLQVLMPNGR